MTPQVRLLKPFLDRDRLFVEVGAGDGAVARAVAPYVKRAIALDVTDVLFRGDASDGLEAPACSTASISASTPARST